MKGGTLPVSALWQAGELGCLGSLVGRATLNSGSLHTRLLGQARNSVASCYASPATDFKRAPFSEYTFLRTFAAPEFRRALHLVTPLSHIGPSSCCTTEPGVSVRTCNPVP